MDKKLVANSAPALNGISAIGAGYFLSQLLENIWAGLWLTAENCTSMEYISPLFEATWGRNLQEVNEDIFEDTIHPDDRKLFLQIFHSAVQKREAYSCAFRIIRPDGELRHIESRGFPLIGENDGKLRMAGIFLDVSSRRKTEVQLLLSRKLGSIGQLAAGLSHEINTPTQFVTDNLTFLDDNLGKLLDFVNSTHALLTTDSDCEPDKEQIERLKNNYSSEDIGGLTEEIPLAISASLEGMKQIRSLTQSVREFAHHSEDRTKLNLNGAIANAISITRHEWKNIAVITTNFEDELPEILCSASAINQVLLNLIVNSIQAIEEKFHGNELGSIEISTCHDDIRVFITINDNGVGISQEIQNKVFTPFFTTKAAGKGTGLGLAISEEIITAGHGGQLLLDSTPGQGTIFTIALPVNPSSD